MRPAFMFIVAGFALAASTSATLARAAACSVDLDCAANGIACGTDVCSKAGACMAAGTDPGTCAVQSDCKCYGLLSVFCNPTNHSCTITSADGGTSGGGTRSDAGTTVGGFDAGTGVHATDSGTTGTGTTDAGGTLPADDAGGTPTGSTSGNNTSGGGSGTVTSNTGSALGSTAGNAGAASGQAASGSTAVGAMAGSSVASGESAAPASKSSSGCTVGFGDRPAYGFFALVLGACAVFGRYRRRR